MSTPFIIRFIDDDEGVLVEVYSKWDGYIDTVGRYLAYRLQTMEILERVHPDLSRRQYGGDEVVQLRYYALGMANLASQVVADLNTGYRGISLHPLNYNLEKHHCYIYEVRQSNVRGEYGMLPHITCRSAGSIFGGIYYQGTPDEYFNYIAAGGPF
tara:strand:- start:2119 stop:2586 length:468 start_codon:yes stop_codon:yes gene_type:complete